MRPGSASLLALSLFLSEHLAQADSVVEAKLKALNPCAGLTTDVDLGFQSLTIGIDRLRELRVEAIDASLRGDNATVSVAGALSCGTSSAAVLKGVAGVRVEASSLVDLSSCRITQFSLVGTEFYGTFSEVVRNVWPVLIQPKIEEEARAQIEQACQDFKAEG